MTREPPRQPLESTMALVTVLYNSEKHLSLFFQSLAQQSDCDFVVVVVDNASKDHSLERAREVSASLGVPCHFIANRTNLGIAEGNNQGINWARSQNILHIVLINNDISCDSSLISAIRQRAIAAGLRAWTCLAYQGDSGRHWYGGGRLSYWRARGIHYSQRRSEAIKTPVAVTYAPTCLMYVHASVFDSVGMMDPQYFVYYDDTDFCRRLNDANICLQYDPDVSFKHYVGGSSGGELSEFFVRISTRNKFIYILRHYSGVRRDLVTALALLSKIAQLANPRLRRATWLGLQDARKIQVKAARRHS
jgi:GT2 family glycosyltransferase